MTENEISEIVGAVLSSLPQREVTLRQANALIAAVRQEAERMGVKAVVAVANAHGAPISVQCADGAYIASYDIAVNKAFTVTALKMSTAALKPLAAPGGSLYGIQFTNNGKIVIFGGGDVLTGKNGEIVGGLGVSGGTEEQDTALSQYGEKWFAEHFGKER